MPRPGKSDSYRSQYVPALQFNSDGLMTNNSAQTQMHVGMQKLIMEQGGRPRRALETEHMRRRQGVIDDYLRAAGGPDKLKSEKWVAVLPTVASPQPVHTGLLNAKNDTPKGIDARRRQQAIEFEGSFLARDKPNSRLVYEEIDDAMREVNEKIRSLTFMQKRTWSDRKTFEFTHEPLLKAVESLNDYFREGDEPLRVKWREIKIGPSEFSTDIYFVYPNTKSQFEKGFKTWMWSENVVDP